MLRLTPDDDLTARRLRYQTTAERCARWTSDQQTQGLDDGYRDEDGG